MPNRLSEQISTYLYQHSAQPVNWWPWCDEAFAEAQTRGVPIFVSIGYASCHWCHVMAEETFTDTAVAELLNQEFVSIKVDRQERPDVDAVSMLATQSLTGQGGWPTSVFLTPEGKPFFAGTYFPPQRRGNMPSFTEVVTALSQTWAQRTEEVLASADQIVAAIDEAATLPAPPAKVQLREAVAAVLEDFDPIHGGFGTAPKFPHPTTLDALLVKGEPASLDVAQRTLEAMSRGGIHDQLGGGFARYSVDAGWVVPHFEKMLYDNALLLNTYSRAWCRTADHDAGLRGLFASTATGIAEWAIAELLTDEGAFAASLDADSADIRGMAHEGIYYLWSPELLGDALGEPDAEWAARVFHVIPDGSFEHGLSTLQLRGNPDTQRLADVKRRLLEVRQERFRPLRDELVIASWNGWMIDSLARSAMIFDRPEWFTVAQAAAEQIWQTHWVDGALRRVSRAGMVGDAAGVLEDYGSFATACLTVYAITGDQVWSERAGQLLHVVVEHFSAPDGGFYDAHDEQSQLYRRPRDLADNATPAGNSTVIAAMHSYALATGDQQWAARAVAAQACAGALIAATPRFVGSALTQALVADEARARLLRGHVTITADDPFNELSRAAYRMAPAGTFIVTRPRQDSSAGVAPSAVVDRGEKVLGPAATVEELRDVLWRRV